MAPRKTDTEQGRQAATPQGEQGLAEQLQREVELRRLQTRVLDLISANASLDKVLLEITQAVDTLLPRLRSSILIVEGGRLRHGAAPQLPDAFNHALDGLPIEEGMGACGTAAFRRQSVVSGDVAKDPLFAPFRTLAREHDIAACWSSPVLDGSGAVLATFALYAASPCLPEPQHLDLIGHIGQFVRVAIERTRHIQHLERSEERYRSLFNLVPVSVWEQDWSAVLPEIIHLRGAAPERIRAHLDAHPDMDAFIQRSVRMVAVNQASLDIFEARDLAHIVESFPLIFSSPDAVPGFKAHVEAMLTGKIRMARELRLRTVNGRLIHAVLDLNFSEVFSHGRVTLSVMDVTARKEAEERFRIVAQSCSDAVWDYHPDSGHIWWSDGLQHVFGHAVTPDTCNVEYWMRHVHPEDSSRVNLGIAAALSGDAGRWQAEYRFRRGDGSYVWVEDKGTIVRDEHGRRIRMIGSMVDISEQKLLQEQLRQSQRLDAIGQLTGGVAHDFNNLLTVILGNAEALAESLTDDQRLRMLADVTTKAAERAAELTQRLLAFARRQPLEPRTTDINRLVAQMDPLLRRTLGEHVEIELVRGGGLWKAMVDPGQLENALLNLCINARDAMPQGGRLTIETANTLLDDDYARQYTEVTPGRYVLVAVSDTGGGMDGATLQRAFEPFFTTKEVGKGSGLGLSMVYGFVKQSCGHVRIYSEPGEGTTIRLYLPRADKDEAQAVMQASDELDLGNERILLVEDDAMVREHVNSLLLQLGYRVVQAANGREALQLLETQGPFDLLFTDVVMPGGLSGRQLADLARQRYPGLPVLYTSGYTENAIVHQGRLDDNVLLLQKPFRRQELAEKVRQALGHNDPA